MLHCAGQGDEPCAFAKRMATKYTVMGLMVATLAEMLDGVSLDDAKTVALRARFEDLKAQLYRLSEVGSVKDLRG